MKRLVFLAVFLLCFSFLGFATDYYVDNTGGSNGNTGLSTGQAWETIAYANTQLTAGDTLYIVEGTYAEGIAPDNSGSDGNPITYTNYSTDTVLLQGGYAITGWTLSSGSIYVASAVNPVFGMFEDDFETADRYCAMYNRGGSTITAKGQYSYIGGSLYAWCSDSADPDTHTMRGVSSSTVGANLNGKDYITIDGINFDYWSHWAELKGGDYNIIQNCTMRFSGYSGITLEGSYNKILDNTLQGGGAWMYHNGESINMNRPAGSGNYNLIQGNTITFGAHTDITLKGVVDDENSCRGNIIRDNTLGRCGGTVMQIRQGKHCLVEDNIMTEAVDDSEVGMGQSGHTGIYITEGHDIIVRRNRSYDNGGGGGEGMSASGGGTYYYAYHNIFVDNYRGFTTGGSATQYIYVKNNIFLSNTTNTLYLDIAPDALALDMYFNNNVLRETSPGDDIAHVYGHSNDDTLAQLEANHATYFYDNIETDPTFTDEPNDDYTLQAGSPCINTGDWLTLTNGSGSNSTTLIVDDAGYFCDGHGIQVGDAIQLQGQAITAVITDINYSTNTIDIDTALTWSDNIGVALAYSGSAPDMGYKEYTSGSVSVSVDVQTLSASLSVPAVQVSTAANVTISPAAQNLSYSLPLITVMGTQGSSTYYVNETSGDDAKNGLSEAEAWETINKVNGFSFTAGDTILFNKGDTWAEQLTVPDSGTSGNPITFGSYGAGADPIIDGGSARAACITGTDFDYITIDGIKCTGWLHAGILNLRGTNWIIQNCTIENGGNDTAPDCGIRVYHTNGDALITGIEIKDNTIGTINTTGISNVGIVAIQLQGVDGAIVSGNTVAPTNTLGIRLGRAGAASANNTGCIVENNDVSLTYGPHISFSRTDSSIMRYNKCYNSKGGGLSVAYSSDNNELYYNLIYNNTEESGLSSYNGIDITQDAQDGKAYNNVVYKVPRHCLMIDDTGAAANGWLIKNNIFDASQNVDSRAPSGNVRTVAIGIRGAGITWTSDNNCLIGKSFVGDTVATNGSFETFVGTADDGNEDAWTGWDDDGTANARFEAVTVADAGLSSIPYGTYCLKHSRGVADGSSHMDQDITLVANTTYVVSFWAMTAGGVSSFRIKQVSPLLFWNGSAFVSGSQSVADLSVGAGDTSWTFFTETFTTSVGSTAYEFEIWQTAAQVGVYFDDFTVGLAADTWVASDGDGDGTLYNYAGWKSATSEDANSTDSAHRMTDPANGDFTLQVGSPCMDAGVDVGLTEDYSGDPVPLYGEVRITKTLIHIGGSLYMIAGSITEGNYDIGAYEYVSPPQKYKDGHLYLRLSERFYLRIH